MKPTIRDVAKRANVSVSTVSRVINKKGYVYEITKDAVDKAIADLGFIPNQLARSLSSRNSYIIGVIFPHIGPTFYGDLLEGIEAQAALSGYKVIFCHTNDDPKRETDYINFFRQYNIDGLIIASNFENTDILYDLDIPIVTVDHIWDETIPSITSDNVKGGKLAAKYFHEIGCKNILLFRGPSFLLTTAERTMGFMKVSEKSGLKYQTYDFDLINPDLVLAEKIIKNNPDIDGIFAFSDTLALVAGHALTKLGKKIPEDVSVIGYDDSLFAKWTTPEMTSISQPVKFMGNQTFMTLIKLIKGIELEQLHEVVDVSLVVRNSTKSK